MDKSEIQLSKEESIVIEPIVENEKYRVNGHLIYKDALRNWSCKHDLSVSEHWAFCIYEKIIIKNPKIKVHTKSIYKVSIDKN